MTVLGSSMEGRSGSVVGPGCRGCDGGVGEMYGRQKNEIPVYFFVHILALNKLVT